jgi:transcriptional regulator with XRE-family HTH domain
VRTAPPDQAADKHLVSPAKDVVDNNTFPRPPDAAPDLASRARVMRGQNPGNGASAGQTAVGHLARELRLAAGLSERALARRSAVARSTVTRLEHGQIRPRRSLLSALAVGIDPDRQKELREQLVAAASDDIAVESDGWRHYRRRRLERGILAGQVPMPSKVADGIRFHRAADAAWQAGMAILHRPGALDDNAALDEANRLLAESRALRDLAGPPMTLYIGGKTIRIGWAFL